MNSATAIQRQSDEVAMAPMLRTDALGSLIWLLAAASMLYGGWSGMEEVRSVGADIVSSELSYLV